MANNRMFLLHKPTGKAVMLAKRFDEGWYVKDFELTHTLALLFSDAFNSGEGLDDWALAMEDCQMAPTAFSDWQYTKDNGLIRTLKITSGGDENA
jgi:hypothetical protein